MPDLIALRGRIIRSRDIASQWEALPSPISDFLGAPESPESLNVALNMPVRFNPKYVAIPHEGKGAYYWAAEINGLRCIISRGRNHPLHIAKITTTDRLRDTFQLYEGSTVEIAIESRLIENLSWYTRMIWNLFWGWGRTSWYTSRLYRRLIGPFWLLRRCATQTPTYRPKLFRKPRLEGISVCHVSLVRGHMFRGLERQTEILIHALTQQGIPRQRVIVLRHGPFARRLKNSEHVEVLLVRGRLSAVFACRGASLIHAQDSHAGKAAHAARIWGCKYLTTRRIEIPVRSNPYNHAMYRNAHAVVAITQAVANTFQGRFSEIPITRIPDAWAPRAPDPNATAAIRDQFAGKFLVGHVAAMTDIRKGQDILIQAAKLLESEFPEIQFLLVGGGRLESEFRRQAKDSNNVHFTGWIKEPWAWIDAFDAFAFPSRAEALGSTLLDVLHAGVPIVASRVDGIPEVITEDCGILVPPNDAEALAEQLLHLYQSPELRQRLAKAAIKESEKYDPALIARQHIDLYRSIDPK